MGVYVRPIKRGTEVVGALDAAADWATRQGLTTLALDVHVDNGRAQAAYRRARFVATGHVHT